MAEQALPRPGPQSPAQPGAPPWGLPVQGDGELGGGEGGESGTAAAPFPRILLGKAAGQEGALGKLESCKPSPVRPSALCDLSWHVCAVGWSQPSRRAAAWHSMAVWAQGAWQCGCSGHSAAAVGAQGRAAPLRLPDSGACVSCWTESSWKDGVCHLSSGLGPSTGVSWT